MFPKILKRFWAKQTLTICKGGSSVGILKSKLRFFQVIFLCVCFYRFYFQIPNTRLWLDLNASFANKKGKRIIHISCFWTWGLPTNLWRFFLSSFSSLFSLFPFPPFLRMWDDGLSTFLWQRRINESWIREKSLGIRERHTQIGFGSLLFGLGIEGFMQELGDIITSYNEDMLTRGAEVSR